MLICSPNVLIINILYFTDSFLLCTNSSTFFSNVSFKMLQFNPLYYKKKPCMILSLSFSLKNFTVNSSLVWEVLYERSHTACKHLKMSSKVPMCLILLESFLLFINIIIVNGLESWIGSLKSKLWTSQVPDFSHLINNIVNALC